MPRWSAAILFFLCAALSITCGFLGLDYFLAPITGRLWVDVAGYASPIIFICATVLVFLRPRRGYILGLAGALAALPWLILTESFDASAWIVLNRELPSMLHDARLAVVYLLLKLKILLVALILIAGTCAVLRLLPARWSLRNKRLNERTWPAFAVGFLVMAAWFVHSVTPYRIPLIVDAGPAQLHILHIEKRGLHFQETTVSAYQNGLVYVSHSNRRLVQFRWQTAGFEAALPMPEIAHVNALADSLDRWKLHTAPAKQLWSWNAEGWYIVAKDHRLFAFSTEYGTNPSREIVELFHEIEQVQPWRQWSSTEQDVCLGFCYGPAAGLGFAYTNQACFALARGATECR